MHGLIFETSVWLLAESTRLLPNYPCKFSQPFIFHFGMQPQRVLLHPKLLNHSQPKLQISKEQWLLISIHSSRVYASPIFKCLFEHSPDNAICIKWHIMPLIHTTHPYARAISQVPRERYFWARANGKWLVYNTVQSKTVNQIPLFCIWQSAKHSQ